MRILMLAQNYAPIVGGEERMVEDLSIELVCRGHDVAVATIRPPSGGSPEIRDGVRVYGVRSLAYASRRLHGGTERPQAPPAPDPLTMMDLRRAIRRVQPQVVHAHNWLVHSYLPLKAKVSAPLVLSLHDYGLLCATKRLLHRGAECSGPAPAKCIRCATEHYSGAKGAAVAVATLARGRALRRGVDLFLPVSNAVSERCRLGPRDRYTVLPNFVRRTSGRAAEDPALAHLPAEPFVLFLGDVTTDKGALHLADVYATVDSPPPLVMVGRCFLDQLRHRPGVRVLGPWPHELAQEAIRRCLFVVVPTLMPEAFGLAALESAALAKAVIASEIGGLPEVVMDGQTGLLVRPGDEAALRSALTRLIVDQRLRSRLGTAAARRAEGFTAEAVVPRFEDAYRLAIDRAGPYAS